MALTLVRIARTSLSPRTSPSYINGVRTVLRTVFTRARTAKKWNGENPVTAVTRREVPQRSYVTLGAEQVPVLLASAQPTWRNVFATALYTRLRKGELFGLLKTDVDMANLTITVERSYDHKTTKGRRLDTIPIAASLEPYLRDAIASSASAFMFPAP